MIVKGYLIYFFDMDFGKIRIKAEILILCGKFFANII